MVELMLGVDRVVGTSRLSCGALHSPHSDKLPRGQMPAELPEARILNRQDLNGPVLFLLSLSNHRHSLEKEQNSHARLDLHGAGNRISITTLMLSYQPSHTITTYTRCPI